MENQITGGDATNLSINTILTNGVQFGSTALGVQTVNSDWDVYMLKSVFNILFKNHKNIEYELVDSSIYSKLLPPNDTCKILYKYKTSDNHYCDILVVEKKETLELMQKVMDDMRKVPQYMLRDKIIRIALFQEAQLRYGFVPAEHDATKINANNFTLKIYPVKIETLFDEYNTYMQNSRNPLNLLGVALYSYLGRAATPIDFNIAISVRLKPATREESLIRQIIMITENLHKNKNDIITNEQYLSMNNEFSIDNNDFNNIEFNPIPLVDYFSFDKNIDEKDIILSYDAVQGIFIIGFVKNDMIKYIPVQHNEIEYVIKLFPVLADKYSLIIDAQIHNSSINTSNNLTKNYVPQSQIYASTLADNTAEDLDFLLPF